MLFIENIFGDTSEVLLFWVGTLLIILGGFLSIHLANAFINRLTRIRQAKASRSHEHKRIDTLDGLLKNFAKYLVYFVLTVTILDRFGVPVVAILSTAGVLGVAVAFGAQSLCRDVITGFFILFEDQYLVGEYIEAQGVSGYVEQFNLRCTYLRDFDGRLHILPNGSMGLVTNHHRGNSRVLVEVAVGPEENVPELISLLQGVADEINHRFADKIKSEIKAIGIVNITASGLVLRLVGQSCAMGQWEIERAIRQEIQKTFKENNIRLSFPHTEVIFKDPSKDIITERSR